MIAILSKRVPNIFQTISYVLFCEHLEDGGNTAKIVILVRDKKMYMYNFFSFSYHDNIQSAYVLYNGYVEHLLRIMVNFVSCLYYDSLPYALF